MHPIRAIKEKVAAAVEEMAVTAPPLVRDAVVAIGDQTREWNSKVLEPAQQRWAEEHGYTHGGMRERFVKRVSGISKYESTAHFLDEHLVEPLRQQRSNESKSNVDRKNVFFLYQSDRNVNRKTCKRIGALISNGMHFPHALTLSRVAFRWLQRCIEITQH